jgi:CheY-like chemotaxis protein
MPKKYTIVFVDDEPASTEALRILMTAEGYRCITFTNMSEAVDFLEENVVHALVTDVMMPSGDRFPEIDSSETGFHFAELVRDQFPDIGVVCLSVIGDQVKIKMLKRMGVLYLRKGETPLATAMRVIESKATGIIRYNS